LVGVKLNGTLCQECLGAEMRGQFQKYTIGKLFDSALECSFQFPFCRVVYDLSYGFPRRQGVAFSKLASRS
jgi:hypothetical protein